MSARDANLFLFRTAEGGLHTRLWLSARLEDWVGSLIVLHLPQKGLTQLRSLLLLLLLLLWLLLL